MLANTEFSRIGGEGYLLDTRLPQSKGSKQSMYTNHNQPWHYPTRSMCS